METKIEIWKDIEGYEGKYQVSNMGRIHRIVKGTYKDVKFHILDGYLMVSLSGDRPRGVHYLVAKHFVPGYFKGAVVNHINENKADNRYFNLEWCTTKYNTIYSITRRHERNTNDVELLKRIGLAIKRERKKLGLTQYKLGIMANLHETIISGVECGRYKLRIDMLIAIANALQCDIDFVRR